eukprot:TRINITY_DN63042_c0_g1_i1.p1 TRINITY_DN63042_c0_g1~~TRINITY_DN63042_c0_g1_i1.p1  ORF type:complete len:308 (-),score=-5.86 TRINITY_DN63042_c0_g1_i1:330-1253(-)
MFELVPQMRYLIQLMTENRSSEYQTSPKNNVRRTEKSQQLQQYQANNNNITKNTNDQGQKYLKKTLQSKYIFKILFTPNLVFIIAMLRNFQKNKFKLLTPTPNNFFYAGGKFQDQQVKKQSSGQTHLVRIYIHAFSEQQQHYIQIQQNPQHAYIPCRFTCSKIVISFIKTNNLCFFIHLICALFLQQIQMTRTRKNLQKLQVLIIILIKIIFNQVHLRKKNSCKLQFKKSSVLFILYITQQNRTKFKCQKKIQVKNPPLFQTEQRIFKTSKENSQDIQQNHFKNGFSCYQVHFSIPHCQSQQNKLNK